MPLHGAAEATGRGRGGIPRSRDGGRNAGRWPPEAGGPAGERRRLRPPGKRRTRRARAARVGMRSNGSERGARARGNVSSAYLGGSASAERSPRRNAPRLRDTSQRRLMRRTGRRGGGLDGEIREEVVGRSGQLGQRRRPRRRDRERARPWRRPSCARTSVGRRAATQREKGTTRGSRGDDLQRGRRRRGGRPAARLRRVSRPALALRRSSRTPLRSMRVRPGRPLSSRARNVTAQRDLPSSAKRGHQSSPDRPQFGRQVGHQDTQLPPF